MVAGDKPANVEAKIGESEDEEEGDNDDGDVDKDKGTTGGAEGRALVGQVCVMHAAGKSAGSIIESGGTFSFWPFCKGHLFLLRTMLCQ